MHCKLVFNWLFLNPTPLNYCCYACQAFFSYTIHIEFSSVADDTDWSKVPHHVSYSCSSVFLIVCLSRNQKDVGYHNFWPYISNLFSDPLTDEFPIDLNADFTWATATVEMQASWADLMTLFQSCLDLFLLSSWYIIKSTWWACKAFFTHDSTVWLDVTVVAKLCNTGQLCRSICIADIWMIRGLFYDRFVPFFNIT